MAWPAPAALGAPCHLRVRLAEGPVQWKASPKPSTVVAVAFIVVSPAAAASHTRETMRKKVVEIGFRNNLKVVQGQ